MGDGFLAECTKIARVFEASVLKPETCTAFVGFASWQTACQFRVRSLPQWLGWRSPRRERSPPIAHHQAPEPRAFGLLRSRSQALRTNKGQEQSGIRCSGFGMWQASCSGLRAIIFQYADVMVPQNGAADRSLQSERVEWRATAIDNYAILQHD